MLETPGSAAGTSAMGVHLYWIPLGAGGVGFVRLNGLIYEAFAARIEHRMRLDLYHTALEVVVPEGRFAVENAWPSPDADTASRGVALEGPVFGRRLARFRPFRYEVRCWRNGTIPDAPQAVASPQHLTGDVQIAQRIIDLVPSVPAFVWGRDELGSGDMWNSNSVVSWLLVRADVATDVVHPPRGGRAPGWKAGEAAAKSLRFP